jgi:hypothetical protein
MKLLYPFAAAALLLTIPTTGYAAEKTYDLAAFTAIDVAAGIDAQVTVGGAQKIVATSSDQREIDELRVEVKDGKLSIWRDWDIFDLFENMSDHQTKVTIAVPALTSAEASSGSDLEVSGMDGDSIMLESSSGADLDATDIRALTISINASSGADLSANGTCTTLAVEASSGASVDLDDLACTDAKAEVSSGADIDLRASGTLKAEASSGGGISVKGKPARTEIDENSGGSVDLGD